MPCAACEKVLISNNRYVTLKKHLLQDICGIDLADSKDSYDVSIQESSAEGDI